MARIFENDNFDIAVVKTNYYFDLLNLELQIIKKINKIF